MTAVTTIGIVGLGLIGGSLAKAYKAANIMVLGTDADLSTQEFARISGAIDGFLTPETMNICDGILIAISPESAANWLRENAMHIPKTALVIDCCGTKRNICAAGFELAKQYGFEYAGGHPMAGTHQWGFKSSRADLFKNACFVVVPRVFDDINLLERIKQLILPAGFGSVSVITAEKHDRIIAFTSQLAHVVSNAYIKSPTALEHRGFSAGSYQDLTRVAWLNPDMWAELFLENGDNLVHELDTIIASLTEYRNAITANDKAALRKLLDDGRKRKEEVDGK